MFFLPHSGKEHAKILWQDGAAVGFYTSKMKGSLCGDGTGVCYLLPVLDTVFVRRRHRRQGLGLAMLRDFCETFPEEEALGVSCPISLAMIQVCSKFLSAHPEERGRLWEVEPPGAWGQRINIWLKIQLQRGRPTDRHLTQEAPRRTETVTQSHLKAMDPVGSALGTERTTRGPSGEHWPHQNLSQTLEQKQRQDQLGATWAQLGETEDWGASPTRLPPAAWSPSPRGSLASCVEVEQGNMDLRVGCHRAQCGHQPGSTLPCLFIPRG
ncbi:protein FAM169B isoform X2 [Erinaceus europaeus]|nr:protein FAM169B isoform X2 [Erinaceus europaeus]